MAITYDQFKIVVRDSVARKRLGLDLSDEDAQVLSQNEAQAIAYFETWHQYEAIVRADAAGRFHSPAIAGFIFSLCSLCFVYAPFWFPGLLGFVGICFSGFSLAPIRAENKRGHGLAVAGTVLGAIGIAVALVFAIIRPFGY